MNSDPNSPLYKEVIAVVNIEDIPFQALSGCDFQNRRIVRFRNNAELIHDWEHDRLNVVAIVSQGEIVASSGINLLETLYNKKFPQVPFFIICDHRGKNVMRLALTAGVADIFTLPLNSTNMETRINFMIDHWKDLKSKNNRDVYKVYKIPFIKRVFDIVFAGAALLFLSPFLLIIYIAIRLESRGPAFYYSLRVGTGYKIFKFFKFRSMYVDADKRLKELKHLNQYNTGAANNGDEWVKNATDVPLCDDCKRAGVKCQFPIYSDNVRWCEKEYMHLRHAKKGSAFFKLKDDPRITRIGKFIRNTSIDELPQLWNVVIGDMSIVGNRPLPLYEAEKLTTDKYALRFMAPAGITGLWQVEKRGKGEMSEEERLMLDNKYAQSQSIVNDVKLILRTIPALLQKENV